MLKATRYASSCDTLTEPVVVLTDDGGSGMYEICKAHFIASDYTVECDARHTVWVRRADGTRSFGLSPWALRRNSLQQVLAQVESKLTGPVSHMRP